MPMGTVGTVKSSTGGAPRDIAEDYDSLQVIGKGSFGTVYRATRKSDMQQVVIKEVLIDSLTEAERRCALQEASTLSKLQHDNIIQYQETRSAEGKLFIVMEFAAGGDLSTAIKRRAQQQRYFSEDQIMLFFVQICLALWHVHTHNFMHRDLKSQNIFLCDNNVAKLGDFGIARSFKHTQDMANTAVGTPYYLSPEICEDKPYNTMSDVWGLGCILYEMATLKRAFEGKSLPALVTKILRGRFSPIPGRYSMHLRSLIHSMLARNPNRRPSVEVILNLPWMRRHLDRYAAHMQHLSRPPATLPRDTAGERASPAGTKHISMLRSQTRTDRSRMASVSLDRATRSSQQRQAQPQVRALPAPSKPSSRHNHNVRRQIVPPLQCKRGDSMARHPYQPHNARGGSVSPFTSSHTPTSPSSARKAERPPWQTPRVRVKHPTVDGITLRRGKLLDRSSAVGCRAQARIFMDGPKQPCRQRTESLESHNSKAVRSSRESNASSTRYPRQPPSIGSARKHVTVSELRSKSQHAEHSQPELWSKSQHAAHAQSEGQKLSAQQAPAHAHNSDMPGSRRRQHESPTIPAGTPADQQPDDDTHSLSSLSSISSHPFLSEPVLDDLGPVASSFWVPPPVMLLDSPPTSPVSDSACLPPFPALFHSQLGSPQRARSCDQRPQTPEPSRLQKAKPKLAPLHEAATDDGSDVTGSRNDSTVEQGRQLRSVHAQARDARKAGQRNVDGQRLVSSTWLAGNFAALDAMQDNLVVPGVPSCTADSLVPSRSVQRQKTAPCSPRTDAESNDGITSHAISPHAHQLSTLESDIDVAGTEIRAVPSLHMISQEPSEAGIRTGADCDMHEAGPALMSPRSRGCARGGRGGQRMRSDDGFDDIMLPPSPSRRPTRQVSMPKLTSPTKLASRPTVAAPVIRVASLARRTQRQTPQRHAATHRRERTRPMNAQQRDAMRQQMQESQQAHRSALQHMQPRLCREEIQRARKDFAARVREVKSGDAEQTSPGLCHHNPIALHEAFVIPLTPRGLRKSAESVGAAAALGVESCCSDRSHAVERPQRRLWVAPRQDGDDSALEMSSDWKNAPASVWSGVASHSHTSGGDGGQKPWRQNSSRHAGSRSTNSVREPVVEIYVPVSTCQRSPAAGAQPLAEQVPQSGYLAPGEFVGPACASTALTKNASIDEECEHTTFSSLGRECDTVLFAESSETGYQRYSTHSTPAEIFDSAKQEDSSLRSERRAVSHEGHVPAQFVVQADAQDSDRTVGRCQDDAPLACGRKLVEQPKRVSREGALGSDVTVGKIEELRESLHAHLGSERFLAAYRVVRKHQREIFFDGQAERAAQAELEQILAPDTHLAYSIYRLLTLEEMVLGS